LWFFGWALFCSSSGNYVDKVLIQYTRAIADAEPGQVPGWSWGIGSACCHVPRPLLGLFQDGEDRRHHRLSTSAAAMVLRAIRHSTSPNSKKPYPPEMNGLWHEDRPTMGSLWTDRRVSSLIYYCTFLYMQSIDAVV
jgi:hypothetical protein